MKQKTTLKKKVAILALLFCLNSKAITIDDFVGLEAKIQQGYMIGVIDTQSAQNAPGSGFDKCALKWLKNESHDSIKEAFEKGVSSMNTATYVVLVLSNVCKESYEFTKKLQQ